MHNKAGHPGEIRKLLVAQVPADFADWLDFVAIGALLAFVWQVDAFVFALLAVAMGLPYLIIGPIAGALVDRYETRTVLVASNVGRAITTATMVLAPDWQSLLLIITLRSSVDSFFTPAKQAAIQTLTSQETRIRANSISHGVNQTAKIIAPSIGGGLMIIMAPDVIFLINAVVSLTAAYLFLRLAPLPAQTPADEGNGPILTTLRAGLSEVSGKPIVRAALSMMALGYFAMFFYDTLIAPLTRELGFTETDLGLSLAAVGAGGVLGALGLSTLTNMRHPFLWIAAGALIAAICAMALGLADLTKWTLTRPLYLGCFFTLGIATSLTVIPIRTILQNTVAESMMGRVTALSEALNTLALLTAPFLGAALATFGGYGAAFIVGGTIMFGVALYALKPRRH